MRVDDCWTKPLQLGPETPPFGQQAGRRRARAEIEEADFDAFARHGLGLPACEYHGASLAIAGDHEQHAGISFEMAAHRKVAARALGMAANTARRQVLAQANPLAGWDRSRRKKALRAPEKSPASIR